MKQDFNLVVQWVPEGQKCPCNQDFLVHRMQMVVRYSQLDPGLHPVLSGPLLLGYQADPVLLKNQMKRNMKRIIDFSLA